MDDELQDEAKALGVNISEVCRDALRHVVANAKAARRHGDDFETVQARRADSDSTEEVEFHGRLIYSDEQGLYALYLTAGENVAVVDEEGFVEYGSLEEMVLSGIDRQIFEEALGQAVTPTFLDI
jgi:hypothetical protein